jgi:hypothetical protein
MMCPENFCPTSPSWEIKTNEKDTYNVSVDVKNNEIEVNMKEDAYEDSPVTQAT